MAYTRIKICGITREQDARLAVEAGADAIGMVFYPPSPRALSVEQAASIAAAVPPFVSLVGLFVDLPAPEVARILEHVPLGLLQFHGDESPEFCRAFHRPWIKSVRMKEDTDLPEVARRYSDAGGLLLDTWRDGVPGGTGEAFDWRRARGPLPLPIVLAGGLSEHNVAAAIEGLHPAAVDVSSGVESAPGIKDAEKIARFVAAVRRVDAVHQG